MLAPVLFLGRNWWLTVDGKIVAGNPPAAAELDALKSMDPDFDTETAGAPGDPVRLTDANRAEWEAAAAIGGHTLDRLFIL